MQSSETSFEAWAQRFDQYLAVARTAQPGPQDSPERDEALLWLALWSDWTAPLAAAAHFPLPGASGHDALVGDPIEPYRELFDELRDEDMVERCPTPAHQHIEPVYSMPRLVRAQIVKGQLTTPDGTAKVRETLASMGQGLATACREVPRAPPLAELWAALATHARDPAAMAAEFDRAVEGAVKERDAAEVRAWIETARPLAALLSSDLDQHLEFAIQRAAMRLELLQRTEIDRRHLGTFLRRADQLAAVRRLLDGPDHLWALHLYGAGGNGKTMLLRYLTAKLAPDKELATARVDFDYLNADYPTRAPGLLLWALAHELQAYGDQEVIHHLDSAGALLRDLHRRLQSRGAAARDLPGGQRDQGSPGSLEAISTLDPTFVSALTLYIAAFKAIPRRILLILDTCEELAKVRPPIAPADNIEVTFRILRALHDGPQVLLDPNAEPSPGDGIPGLRVILAGRRLLAGRGHDWRAPSSTLPRRSYLRLHEMRGFTCGSAPTFQGEARDYLTLRAVPEDLLTAIIRGHHRPDGGALVQHSRRGGTGPSASARTEHDARVNPYELRLFAEWANEIPPPAPAALEGASAVQYAQLRIVERLRSHELAELLPAVALLGHVDRDILGTVAGQGAAGAEELFQQLREQEWVTQRTVAGAGGGAAVEVLDVDPPMQSRLLEYYSTLPAEAGRIQERAADVIETRTLGRPLAELDWSFFDAALRTLEHADPVRAARWWAKAERRILDERDAAWALAVTGVLQGDLGAAAPVDPPASDAAAARTARGAEPSSAAGVDEEATRSGATARGRHESRLRAAVLATHASALLHTDAGDRLREVVGVWQEVRNKADLHPDSHTRDALRLRALAGSVAMKYQVEHRASREDAAALWREINTTGTWTSSPQLAAALVAAAEALVEQAEALAMDGPEDARTLLIASRPDEPATTDDPAASSDGPGEPSRLGPAVLADALAAAAPSWSAGDGADDGQTVSGWSEAVATLVACAQALAARALAIDGNYPAMDESFRRALLAAPEAASRALSAAWDDWRPPDDPAARIRLERERVAYRTCWPRLRSEPAAPERIGEQSGANVDRDRLSSAMFREQSAHAPVSADQLAALGMVASRDLRVQFQADAGLGGKGRCRAHDEVPPLFATVTESLAAAGHPDQALPLLRQVSSEATRFRPETVCHAERSLLRITRRMRLRDAKEGGGESLVASTAADRALLWILGGMDGPKNRGSIPAAPIGDHVGGSAPAQTASQGQGQAEWLHAIWSTLYAADDHSGGQALEWARRLLVPAAITLRPNYIAGFFDVAVWLDVVEANELARHLGAAPIVDLPTEGRRPGETFDPVRWWEEHDDQPEAALRLCLRAECLDVRPGVEESWIAETLLARLGTRRAAEIALDEGERLALRLPIRAAPLLERAEAWFAVSGDAVGSVLSGGVRALVWAREGSGSDLIDALADVGRAYERMRRGDLTEPGPPRGRRLAVLPPWTRLEALAGKPDSGALDQLGPPGWRPWLARLVACLARRQQLQAEGDFDAATLVRWVRDRYGSISPSGASLLPSDFADWLEELDRTQPRIRFHEETITSHASRTVFDHDSGTHITTRRHVRRVVRRSDDSSDVVSATEWTLAAELAHSIAFDLGAEERKHLWTQLGIELGTSLADRIVHQLARLPEPTALIQFLAEQSWLSDLGHALFRLRPDLASDELSRLLEEPRSTPALPDRSSPDVVAAASSMVLRIFPDPGRAAEPLTTTDVRPIHMSLMIQRDTPADASAAPAAMTVVTDGARTPGLAPYGMAAGGLPDAVVSQLRALRKSARPGGLEVVIEPTAGLHGPCWEGLLAMGAGESSFLPRDLPFRFRRRVASTRTPHSLARTDAPQIIAWVGSSVGDAVARRGWERLRREPRFELSVQRAEAVEESRGAPDRVRIVHMVGIPAESYGRPLFCIGGEPGAERRWAAGPAGFPRLLQEEGLLGGSARLITADDVARAFPNLAVCVLEGEPSPAQQRLEGHRHDAMLARTFAAELLERGVPIILVLPPIEARLAVAALDQVADAILRRVLPGTLPFLEVVANIQNEIAATCVERGDPWDAGLEWAFDVCLFASERRDLHMD